MPGKAHQCMCFNAGLDKRVNRPRRTCPKPHATITSSSLAGFTLIEILIVIVVVGIISVLATANLFQTDEEKLQWESEKILAVLQVARDEAAFGGRVIAVTFADGQVHFLERDFADPSRWNASTIEALKPRALPEALDAQLRVGPAGAASKDSHITFLPAGVAAPFELALRGPAGSRKIAGDAIGHLRLTKA